ncbi:MAG: GyrI-like domain-containing protein [Thaumarchaeota archaeon]|nr:GyrI-like domain-containing protein [Nitrososphaerota archaeon]
MDPYVTLEDIPVMFVRSRSGPKGAREAFDTLESRLANLKGRRFYGTFLNGEYCACVARISTDEPATAKLEEGTIPGGVYARRKIDDWESKVPRLALMFEEMASQNPVDVTRPSVEFYRSQKELILLLPVRASEK